MTSKGAGEVIASPPRPFLEPRWTGLAIEGARYFGASVVALGVDYGILVLLHRGLGVQYLAAAALSFTAGLAVAWVLSVVFVFHGRRKLSPWREFAGFAATGLAGLVLTQAALAALVSGVGLAPELAKVPVAGCVFLFNFASRRYLLFSPAQEASRVAARPSAGLVVETVLAGVAAIAIFALTHPFGGLSGDAQIYLGRALADIDPAGVGRDMMFALDGQSSFSLFRPLARTLVAWFTPLQASMALTLGSQALWIAALLTLASRFGARWAWVVAIAAIVPACYGGGGVLSFGEALAEPRPFAEAFVLFALSAWLADRRIVAGGLLAVALTLHPLMALAGVGAIGLLLMREHARWRVAAAGAALAIIAAASLGAPLADRLFTLIDAQWLAVLRERNAYIFPDLWSADVFSLAAVQAATLLFAATRTPSPRLRDMFAVVLILGIVGIAASWMVGSFWPSVLGVQVQLWRAWWLTAAISAVAFGLCVVTTSGLSPHRRIALALLTLAWTAPTGFPLAPPACALAALFIELRGVQALPTLTLRHATWVWWFVAALVAGKCLGSFDALHHLLATTPEGTRPHVSHVVFSFVQDLLIVGIVIAAINADRLALHSLARRAAVTTLLAGAAAAFWNDASSFQKVLDRGEPQSDLVQAASSGGGEVLWLGANMETWFWLGQPTWIARIQGAGLAFSRPLALRYSERARVLRDLGIEDLLTFRGSANASAPTDVALDTLCHRADAPASIVVPLERGTDARPGWRAHLVWTAPAVRVEMPQSLEAQPVASDRYAVIACVDHRQKP